MPNKDTQFEGNVGNIDNQTFTQEQVNSIVGKEKEKYKSKYANFDEYKKAFDELNTIKEQNKTELEKMQDRAERAEKELNALKTSAELQKIKTEISKSSGVPVEVLTGNSREELEEQAETLKPIFEKYSTPQVQNDGYAPAEPKKGATNAEIFGNLLNEKMKG